MANADDAKNLAIACRSCNTIKGEMTEGRFHSELTSLAAAVVRMNGQSGETV